MKNSIAKKIYLLMLSGILSVMVITGILFYFYQSHKLYADFEETSSQIAKRLEYSLVQPLWEYNYDQIGLVLSLEMEYPHLYAITIETQNKAVVIGKIKDENGKIMDYKGNNWITTRLQNNFKTIQIDIKQNENYLGTSRIYFTDQFLKNELDKLIISIIVQTILLSFIMALLVIFSLDRLILRKIIGLDNTVQHFAKKEFSVRSKLLSDDEIGRLSASFNEMAGIIQDYSAKMEEKIKERTLELEKANQYQTNFFANISHELRTPLTLILGPLETILNRKPGDSIGCGDDQFKMMRSSGLKLLKLVNNLLDYTKIESYKMTVQRKKTDIRELLQLYTSIVITYAETKRISVVFNDNTKYVSGNLIARVDRDLLEKAVFNLLSNAFKFTPDNGSIIIQLDREEYFFTIAVKDTGIGIAEDKLDVIFERFTQIDGSARRKYEGTGIGLALTKELVEIMGGTIRVVSRLGEGSVFTIRLPFALEGEADPNEEIEQIQEVKPYLTYEFSIDRKGNGSKEAVKPKTGSLQAQRILIVEDSKEMQDYLISLLERDYEIHTADNGLQGLEKAEKIRPDLILADIMMPEMDGYEMTGQLKSKGALRDIPLLMLTAKADMDMKLEGFEKGAVDYMIKPFHASELKARVKAHLDMKELRDCILGQRNELMEQKRVLQETMEQKDRAQKQLQESEQRFREMAEYSPMALVEMDENMRITYLNQSGFELFGVDAEEIKKGLSFSRFLDPGEQGRFNGTSKRILLQGCAENAKLHEFRFRTRDGRETIGLFKAAALYKENRIVGLRATITELKTYMDLALLPEDDFYAEYNISSREKEVFLHILKGYKNREIGEKLFISERTVKKHTSNILEKTQTHNKRDLFKLVKEHQNPQAST